MQTIFNKRASEVLVGDQRASRPFGQPSSKSPMVCRNLGLDGRGITLRQKAKKK